MEQAGIREFKQNASSVVAAATTEDSVVVTMDRGELVLQPHPSIERVRASVVIRPATRSLSDLPAPEPAPEGSPVLGEVLRQMRDDERY